MKGASDMKDNASRKFDFDHIGPISDSTTIFGTTVGVFNKSLEERFREIFREIEFTGEKGKAGPASQDNQ